MSTKKKIILTVLLAALLGVGIYCLVVDIIYSVKMIDALINQYNIINEDISNTVYSIFGEYVVNYIIFAILFLINLIINILLIIKLWSQKKSRL